VKRNISSLGLLCTSVSAILGSGWLFGSFFAAQMAGPASLISWVIGGIMVCVVAFTFGEICALMPVSGSSVRIPHFTHGKTVSIVFSLIVWISYVALMVIEVEAVVEYLSFFYPWMFNQTSGLTGSGYLVSCILMFIIAAINTYSVKWLINLNTFLTFIKVVVPILVSLVILFFYFSFNNIVHPANSSFAPNGLHGIFMAISAGGIIFSFNAFKQAADLAGEAKKPSFAVPFAIVGSIVICLVIFLLLQSSFISALNINNLANGWSHLTLNNNNSPFISILTQSKILWLLPILLITAVISPFAAGLMYGTGGSRALFGMANNGVGPKWLLKLNSKEIPFISIWINFALGLVIFQFFNGWDTLATFLTCLFAVSYSAAPICLIALRRQLPGVRRPLKLPFGFVWSYIAFFFCTLFIYWTGWETMYKVAFFFIFCLIVAIFNSIFSKGNTSNIKESIWMWVYFAGLIAISYIGNYGNGLGLLSETYIMVLIACLCLIVFIFAFVLCLPSEQTKGYMNNINKNN